MQALLLTYSGPVGHVEMPPFKKLPEVLVWGTRTFVLDPVASVTPDDGEPVYREGCAWVATGELVPEANMLASDGPPFPELAVDPVDRSQRVSTSGRVLDPYGPAPDPETDERGQHKGYWVLSEAERGKGFVRPVRKTYQHLQCGTNTTMGQALAETFARDPTFYGATFCCRCAEHRPVGAEGEFVWCDRSGNPTGEKVGS